jgi:hypothetical protein
MAQKTTSSSLAVGEYAYIFINRPDTQYIEFIRFKKPEQVQTGKIGRKDASIFAKEGPVDCLSFSDKSIRVYYIGINAQGQNLVREVKLANADSDDTDPKTGWTEKADDLIFEDKVDMNTRLVDPTSFLAVNRKNGQPVVSYKVNNANSIRYNYFDGKKYQSTTLDLPTT